MTDDGVLLKRDIDVRFPRRKVCFHIFSLAFVSSSSFRVIFLWALWTLLSPAPPHLYSFQTGNHSTFEGCYRKKQQAIVDSVGECLPGHPLLHCSLATLHTVTMLFFLEHSWDDIIAILQFKGIQLAHFQLNNVECLSCHSQSHHLSFCGLCMWYAPDRARSCFRIMDSPPQTSAHTQGSSCPRVFFFFLILRNPFRCVSCRLQFLFLHWISVDAEVSQCHVPFASSGTFSEFSMALNPLGMFSRLKL